MSPKNQKKSAFTLVEIVLYCLLVSVLAVFLMAFALDIQAGRTRYLERENLGSALALIQERITQEILQAEGLNGENSVLGQDSSVLWLTIPDGEFSAFYVNENNALIWETGTEEDQILMPSQFVVERFYITNLAPFQAPSSLKIEIEIRHENPGNRDEYDLSAETKFSVTIRQ